MHTLAEDLAERIRGDGDASADIWRAFADRELFALLELYKQGEAVWGQDEPVGEITITPSARDARMSA